MKGLKAVAKKSGKGVNIYYDIKTQTVNVNKKGYLVTTLLRKNTEKEIEATICRWMNL